MCEPGPDCGVCGRELFDARRCDVCEELCCDQCVRRCDSCDALFCEGCRSEADQEYPETLKQRYEEGADLCPECIRLYEIGDITRCQ